MEDVHFDRVEQLVAQANEDAEEVAKVEIMVQTFQDKVYTTTHPKSVPTT